MHGIGWLAAIVVGGLAGWFASAVMKADTGVFVNIALGIVGALLANWVLGLVGIHASGTWVAQGIVGFIGACALIWAARALRR